MNLQRISSNLEKFKEQKPNQTSNPKWKAKKTYLSELQPEREDWFDVYKVNVSRALHSQHSHDDDQVSGESESHCAKAFSKIDEGDSLNGEMTESFQA